MIYPDDAPSVLDAFTNSFPFRRSTSERIRRAYCTHEMAAITSTRVTMPELLNTISVTSASKMPGMA